MGRSRKPAVLRIAEGNAGHRPIPDEVIFDNGKPIKPKSLSGDASRKWDQLFKQLEKVNLLQSVDGDALVTYCEAWALYRQATDKINERIKNNKPFTVRGGNGGEVMAPEFRIQKQALQTLQLLWQQFGLSPKARANLGDIKQPENNDPFSKALGR